MTDSPPDFDVVILGGAYSGSVEGLLLRRHYPNLRVLIVESRTEFDRKVGESTSDVAACFLTRVLRLNTYLVREHLPKQGLRFWFNARDNDDPARCAEMGSYFQVRLPTFQIDRSTLDEHLLDLAAKEGCTVWRPAKIKEIHLGGIGKNIVEIEMDGQRRTVTGRWVVDASGKAAILGRKHKAIRPLEDHPTNSMWVRYRNVGDLDGPEATAALKCGGLALPCPRMMATNHLSGRGWWCWIIPLKNGDVSAGLTYDTRLFTPPEGGSIGERLKAHLCTHPIGRLMFENAEPLDHDARAYSHLPYFNEEVAGDGWACIGDAAGFMDPLYSQGLDYCSHSAYYVHRIIGHSFEGRDVTKEIAAYRRDFAKSYRRWYKALYRDKYHYLGDADLMWVAFLLDLATYFIGPVRLVYDHTDKEFARMPYFGPAGAFFAWWMSVYNRRLTKIAEKRLATGTYGQNNLDRRLFLRQGFSPDTKVLRVLRQGLWAWLKLEVRSLFLHPRKMSVTSKPMGSGSPAAPLPVAEPMAP